MEPLDLARMASVAAQLKKASRLVLLDLRNLSDISDFQLICSGDNTKQTRAIADSIEESLKKDCMMLPLAVEGKQGGSWILIDYGATIIHIFSGHLREYYALEELWPKAKYLKIPLVAPEEDDPEEKQPTPPAPKNKTKKH